MAVLALWNPLGNSAEVPSQSFGNPIQSIGENSGGMAGQILFPSEYTQRSITVKLDGRPFVTHPDGRILIDWVPHGSHLLTVRVKGFEPIEREIEIAPDQILRLPSLRLELARGKVIGRLVWESGKSASDIALRLSPMGGITASDNDGIFQFIGVNSGEHLLQIEDGDFTAVLKPFQLKPNESVNLGLIQVERRDGTRPAEVSYNGNRP